MGESFPFRTNGLIDSRSFSDTRDVSWRAFKPDELNDLTKIIRAFFIASKRIGWEAAVERRSCEPEDDTFAVVACWLPNPVSGKWADWLVIDHVHIDLKTARKWRHYHVFGCAPDYPGELADAEAKGFVRAVEAELIPLFAADAGPIKGTPAYEIPLDALAPAPLNHDEEREEPEGAAGRPFDEHYDWAYEQIYKLGRNSKEVYRELKKRRPEMENSADAFQAFQKAMLRRRKGRRT